VLLVAQPFGIQTLWRSPLGWAQVKSISRIDRLIDRRFRRLPIVYLLVVADRMNYVSMSHHWYKIRETEVQFLIAPWLDTPKI
jgi:hypothetical protein